MFIVQCDQPYTNHRLESSFMSSALQAALQDALLLFAATITAVGYVPHVRVDVLLKDADVKEGN